MFYKLFYFQEKIMIETKNSLQCTIIGAGAMGCLFASMLHKNDIKVHLLENNTNIIKLAENGITIKDNDQETSYKIPITSDLDIIKESTIIIVFVKSFSTESLLKTIKPYIDSKAIIVSLQNGLLHSKLFQEYIPEDQYILGSTTYGASSPSPGKVILGGIGTVVYGGRNSEAKNLLSKIFTQCNIDHSITDDALPVLWEKALINSAINPIAAILKITNGQIIENLYARNLQKSILREAVQAAKLAGYSIEYDYIYQRVIDVCKKTSSNRCSMLQDQSNNRRTEIDSINGFFLNIGEQSNQSFPVNNTIVQLIKAREVYLS